MSQANQPPSPRKPKVFTRTWWATFGGVLAAVTTVAASIVTVVAGLPVLISLFHQQPVVPSSIPTELQRTPELGLEFWSADNNPKQYRIYKEHDDDGSSKYYNRVEIAAKPAPFEIHFPTLQDSDTGMQICAWTDDSIFNVTQGGDISRDYDSPFTPGKGLADTSAGSARLPVTNRYNSYWIDGRVDHFSSTKDKIYISTINDTPAAQWKKTLFLTVWIDKNLDYHTDNGEYEYITIHFDS